MNRIIFLSFLALFGVKANQIQAGTVERTSFTEHPPRNAPYHEVAEKREWQNCWKTLAVRCQRGDSELKIGERYCLFGAGILSHLLAKPGYEAWATVSRTSEGGLKPLAHFAWRNGQYKEDARKEALVKKEARVLKEREERSRELEEWEGSREWWEMRIGPPLGR